MAAGPTARHSPRLVVGGGGGLGPGVGVGGHSPQPVGGGGDGPRRVRHRGRGRIPAHGVVVGNTAPRRLSGRGGRGLGDGPAPGVIGDTAPGLGADAGGHCSPGGVVDEGLHPGRRGALGQGPRDLLAAAAVGRYPDASDHLVLGHVKARASGHHHIHVHHLLGSRVHGVSSRANRINNAETRARSNSSWCRKGPRISLTIGAHCTKESRAWPDTTPFASFVAAKGHGGLTTNAGLLPAPIGLAVEDELVWRGRTTVK